ncbi:MAG: cyclic nucleotide-binding domain-containing protein [Rubrivivax sp.]|nr:cyclic nucleotide-binding domain-containing protein [Rubrivivax sp.]
MSARRTIRDAPEDPLAAAPLSDSLRALARRGELRRLRKGVQIISEGDRGDTLYIVLAGELRAYGVGADEREVTYGCYGAGEYVGEMGLDGGPRSANVETGCADAAGPGHAQHGWKPTCARTRPSRSSCWPKVIRRARAATLGFKQIALNGSTAA